MTSPRLIELLDQYEVILLDAYGVLVNRAGALPGAAELIWHLNATNKPYFILTNAASRTPAQLAQTFAEFGLAIPAARVITSGSLLETHFAAHHLTGIRCLVLGTAMTCAYVESAGGVVVAPEEDAEAIIVADQSGFPFLETLDAALNLAFHRIEAALPLHLICCNPDLIYPLTATRFGFTTGALELLLSSALRERYGHAAPSWVHLGKPHPAIFAEAARRAGSHNMLMVGDQLRTDIAGALNFGIDAALLPGGVRQAEVEIRPTYVLAGLV